VGTLCVVLGLVLGLVVGFILATDIGTASFADITNLPALTSALHVAFTIVYAAGIAIAALTAADSWRSRTPPRTGPLACGSGAGL
jgi:hypothetical protein